MHEHVSVAEGKMSFLGDETNACASNIGACNKQQGSMYEGTISWLNSLKL